MAPALQPAAHALRQVSEELPALLATLGDAEAWARPGGSAPIGFHALHLAGSLDRLCAYARGETLNAAHLAAYAEENAAAETRPPFARVRDLVERTLRAALAQVEATPEGALGEPREVGRAKLPSTVLGVLAHSAEHTVRHAGQIATLARVVRGAPGSAGRTAEEIAASLGLAPHPEGGLYREWHRSSQRVDAGDGRGGRAAMTSIHFLLPRGDRSRWHVLRSDETWTYLEGAPLDLFIVEPNAPAAAASPSGAARLRLHRLGPDSGFDRGAAVPAGAWQAARSTGEYTLVSCTVAPGFEFEDFRLLHDDPAAAARIRALGPEPATLL
ncbi:MAG TPA: cupin domain-containing protein [Candidatus Eisenbacteria bacterium]|nr:cupin domain-containing protein [Candidatus Eisenbacteria bacterium]